MRHSFEIRCRFFNFPNLQVSNIVPVQALQDRFSGENIPVTLFINEALHKASRKSYKVFLLTFAPIPLSSTKSYFRGGLSAYCGSYVLRE